MSKAPAKLHMNEQVPEQEKNIVCERTVKITVQ